MNQNDTSERRQHPRFKLAAMVDFHHEPTDRDFPGKSVDISAGGLMMYLPATVPVQKGQGVSVTVGDHDNPEFAGLGDEISGKIARVNRDQLLSTGNIAIGVEFNR